jgi:Zn-dependent protease/CBS domain-containing protein
MAAEENTPRGVFGGGAWSLGRIAGIEIAIDHSWVLIFALITFSLKNQLSLDHVHLNGSQAWLTATVTSLLFFGSILLHELGHSLTAQRLGLQVRSITLFIFGGVAQLASDPKRPWDEVLIALAGPAVSVGLALVFGAMAGPLADADGFAGIAEATLSWLARINMMLAIFNCIPGFPLDGGRVLRGVVWAMTGSFERATRVAAASGSFVAYTLILMGIFTALIARQLVSGIWLAFIGWFLLSAARASVGQAVSERVLSRVLAREAMDSVTAAISGEETVADLTSEAVLRHGVRTFYVVDSVGALLGLVTLRELAGVADEERGFTRARDVMRPLERLVVIEPNETAWSAVVSMTEHSVNQLPVVSDGKLVGSVTRERLLGLVQASVMLRSRRPI